MVPPVQLPVKPAGNVTLRTSKPALPTRLILNVRVAVVLTGTVPNVRSPVRNMWIPQKQPEPETGMVLLPLVLLAFTTICLPYSCSVVGANVTITGCRPPGAMVPPAQLPLKPAG